MIRALVVDDEAPARARIRSLLRGENDVRVVGECRDARETVVAIETDRPHLVFLDVQMPEGGGFAVVERIGAERMPSVIFTTAYDEFAVRAFEVHALDYLLKPFDRDRFRAALQRARSHLLRAPAADVEGRIAALLAELRPGEPLYADRLPVRSGGRIRFVKTEAIDYLQAEDNYVRLHVGPESYLIRETLGGLEAKLDPRRFVRVHRSVVVNLERVQELEPLFQGEYLITLQSGARVASGRSFRTRLQEVLRLR